MPEGDTIFRTARTLHRALAGKVITGFRSAYALLTRYNENTPLAGQVIERVESRGKWVLIYFSGGGILATHMLMNGSWHIYRPGERWQQPASNMRMAIETRDFVAVGFSVPLAEIHTAQSLERDRRIPPVASDVLGRDFDEDDAVERLLSFSDFELGEALLRQKVLAGVGNVFKSEICFAAGLNPFRKVASLTREQLAEVVSIARRQLGANVLEDSGNQIVTYRGRRRRTTHRSDPGESLWVYGRAGQPCRRCGEPIWSRLQGADARTTYWCPGCQPIGRN
ncbi:MAG TPA: DNA-formamidopyrimidine glycosylase family protein [Terracidiphilus sp.]|nr:DNA-formamidopyrimidine glycosylase family protein [Terracidiphilus sp.]